MLTRLIRFGRSFSFLNALERGRRRRQRNSRRHERANTEALEPRVLLASVTVNNTLDAVNGTTSSIADLIANDGGDGISLREAVAAANSNPDADTITFASGPGEAFENGGTIQLMQGEIAITGPVTIDGSSSPRVLITGDAMGNDATNSGITDVDATGAANLADNSRILNVTSDSAPTELIGLTLTGGRTTGDNMPGGAIRSLLSALTIVDSTISGNSTSGRSSRGGGFAVDGNATVTNSTISGNSTSGPVSRGGGFVADRNATVTNSTISGNRTIGDFARGGGFVVSDSATVSNSTISGNRTAGFASRGGGFVATTGTVTASTVSGNSTFSSTSRGGGLEARDIVIANSIILGNDAPAGGDFDISVSGTQTETGPSLVGTTLFDGSGGSSTLSGTVADVAASVFAGTINFVDLNGDGVQQAGDGEVSLSAGILAGKRADNGGRVQTIALIADAANPALDAGRDDRLNETVVGIDLNGDGDTVDTISTDARGPGFVRLFDLPMVANNGVNVVDLGSFELQAGDGETRSLVVTTTADVVDPLDNQTSLREAIAFANDPAAGNNTDGDADNDGNSNDTITFAASLSGETLALTQGELAITTPTTITGPGAELLTIDAGGGATPNPGDGFRHFLISDGDFSRQFPVNISGLTLTGGDVSGRGGAILSRENLTLTDSTISGNTAGENGGGVSAYGTTTVTNSTVTGNATGESGGGIAGAVSLNRSTIANNTAVYGGGGLHNPGASPLSVTGSTITGNMALRGGGIFTNNGPVTVTDSTLSGNTAQDGGGILSNTDTRGTTTTITNSTVSGNTATGGYGGGLFNADGLTIIQSSTITGNRASAGNGSGVASDAGDTRTEVTGTIIADNANEDVASVRSAVNTFVSNGFNLVGTGAPLGSGNTIDTFNQTGDQTSVSASLAPLNDNGGPTQTHALPMGSPALNAGDPAALAGQGNTPLFDQRGSGFDRVADGRIDIGAFELQVGEAEARSLIVTTAADVVDPLDNQTSLREAIAFANDPAAGNNADGDADNDGSSTDSITFASGSGDAFENGGTIFLAAALDEFQITSDIGIDGDLNNDGTPDVTIDADSGPGMNDADSRVLTISSGNVAFDGVTITDGDVIDARIWGGGIFLEFGASLDLTNSVVTNNSSYVHGGGIESQGTLTASGTTFSGNASTDGGDGSTGGGAIFGGPASRTVLVNSIVSGNTSDFIGGGLSIAGELLAIGTTIHGNTSQNATGGGISGGGNLTLVNTTVSGNRALIGGGGIENTGSLELTNSTVTGNHSSFGSGGIQGPVTLANSIVLGNSAPDNTETNELSDVPTVTGRSIVGTLQLESGGASSSLGATTAAVANDVFAETLGFVDLNGDGVQQAGNGEVSLSADTLAGKIADNGGLVRTVALKADTVNPAIDAGDGAPAIALDENALGVDLTGDGDTDDMLTQVSDLAFDARGPGFERSIGTNVDLGAYETPPLSTPENTFVIDGSMLLVYGRDQESPRDRIVVRRRPGSEWLVRINGVVDTFTDSNITQVKVFAFDGNDYTQLFIEEPTEVHVETGAGANTVRVQNDGPTRIIGGDDHDKLTVDGDGVATIDGGGDFDDIKGGNGNDILRGGDGDDLIQGRGGNDILLGEEGADRLLGGAGNDLVFGGVDTDNLRGDSGDDLLIAGTTSHDSDDAALQMILAEWTSGAPATTRVANIRTGGGLTGGNALSAGSTVFDDGVPDTIKGSGGDDWVYHAIDDVLTDSPEFFDLL